MDRKVPFAPPKLRFARRKLRRMGVHDLLADGFGSGRRGVRSRCLEVRSILAGHQRIHRELLSFMVDRQSESLSEQSLQHLGDLILGSALRHPRRNVKALRSHPIRSGQLVQLDAVRPDNQLVDRHEADVHARSTDGSTFAAARNEANGHTSGITGYAD